MDKEDLIEYKETLKFLKDDLKDLCNRFNLIPINLKTDRKYLLKCQEPARFNSLTNTIFLNRFFVLKSTVRKIIRHEFRHYWQQENYKMVYDWWLVENAFLYNALHNTKNADRVPLSHIHCPLEIDAIAFETSDNGNEEILIAFQKEMRCNASLLQRYTDILDKK